MTPSYVDRLRQFVGHEKLMWSGTAACIRDGQGRVLLQRRRDNGQWEFPSGHQELGESATDAVRREVLEEMGLVVEPRQLIGLYSSPQLDKTYPNGDQVQMSIAF